MNDAFLNKQAQYFTLKKRPKEKKATTKAKPFNHNCKSLSINKNLTKRNRKTIPERVLGKNSPIYIPHSK